MLELKTTLADGGLVGICSTAFEEEQTQKNKLWWQLSPKQGSRYSLEIILLTQNYSKHFR